MAENKNIENLKKIEDDILEKIAGGVVTDEEIEAQREKAQEALEKAGQAGENFANTLSLIDEAVKTNICPICKQQIVPGAKKCKVIDFLNHKHVNSANNG